VALAPGQLSQGLVERLFIRAKQACPHLLTTRKFWVNIQAATPLTRKPENVRMGKGKGARAGLCANVYPGTTLLAFSTIRQGQMRRVFTWVGTRCQFQLRWFTPVGCEAVGNAGLWPGLTQTWVRSKRVQPRYATEQFTTLRTTLVNLRRPHLLGYFTRVFWWRFVVPHAIWVPARGERWALRS